MSSVKKYLLFAVGAIALMFIGILLNLQITNWNEARKAAHQEFLMNNETYPEIQSQIKALVNQIFEDGAAKKLKELDEYHLNSPKFSRLESESILTYEEGKELEEAFYGNNEIISYSLPEHKVDVFDDMAISSSHLDLKAIVGHDTTDFKVKISLVFANKGGEWKIVHEHISPRE